MENDVINLEEMFKILDKSPNTVRKWAKEKIIPAVNDFENICTGADIILAALQEAEGKYLSIIYAPEVKIDRNDKDYILPMCTAYEVTMECKKEMFDKIIDLC